MNVKALHFGFLLRVVEGTHASGAQAGLQRVPRVARQQFSVR
jgi:hypothetical protein